MQGEPVCSHFRPFPASLGCTKYLVPMTIIQSPKQLKMHTQAYRRHYHDFAIFHDQVSEMATHRFSRHYRPSIYSLMRALTMLAKVILSHGEFVLFLFRIQICYACPQTCFIPQNMFCQCARRIPIPPVLIHPVPGLPGSFGLCILMIYKCTSSL